MQNAHKKEKQQKIKTKRSKSTKLKYTTNEAEQGKAEDLIRSPKEQYTKQLIKAASPGWLKSLSFNNNTNDKDVGHV